MKLTWRDGLATLVFAAIVVPFGGYLIYGSMPFLQDPTGMAGLVLVLGVIGTLIGGWIVVDRGFALEATTVGAGLISAALGVAALVSENFWDVTTRNVLLVGAVALIAVLWVIAIALRTEPEPGETGWTEQLPT